MTSPDERGSFGFRPCDGCTRDNCADACLHFPAPDVKETAVTDDPDLEPGGWGGLAILGPVLLLVAKARVWLHNKLHPDDQETL